MKNHFIVIRPLPEENTMRVGTLFLPLGPLYIAEALERNGFELTILDAITQASVQEIDRSVKDDTLAVGVSTMSGTQLKNSIHIARYIRENFAGLPIIWGGVHVTHLPKDSLASDLVDIIVWGEGEETIIKLLNCIRDSKKDDLNLIDGIGYKNNGDLIITRNSGYTDLRRVFSLPYHKLNMDTYARQLTIGAQREFPIWTSRGCPFDCTFCSNGSYVWSNRKVRYHTIESIVRDIKALKTYQADMITIADENFLLDQKRLIDIIGAVREEGISLKYRFAARVDMLLRVKESTWEMLKDYGVVNIGTAPESGSQRILNYMRKGITVEQIYKCDDILSKYGFTKCYNFLLGVPRETKADVKETLRMICRLTETSMDSPHPIGTLHKYIPLPGTEMYEDAKRLGFKPPISFDDWAQFDLSDFPHTIDTVRPWLSKDYYEFLSEAIRLIENLNSNLIGKKTDSNKVNKIVREIELFILKNA